MSEEAKLGRAIEAGVLARWKLEQGNTGKQVAASELRQVVEAGRRAWAELLESQLLTVRSLAGQAARCFKLEFAELFQEGYLELTEALMRYDYQIGNFTPYAYHRVKERLYQLCASRLGTMNLPRWTAVRRFHETNEHRKGGEQTELVEYQAPIPLEATKERHVSFSEPAFTQIELQHSLDHAMQALTEREEEIIVARFGLDGSRPLSRQELAIKLRSSVGTVRRLEREAIATLKRVLVDE